MGMLIEQGESGREELFAKLGVTPESLREDVRHLREWMQKQPHLPDMRHVNIDVWLENQLIMSKNSLEKAKNSVERYCSVRSICPEFFSGSELISTTFEQSFSNLSISYLPGLSPRLHKVCIVRIESPDCEQFFFESHMKRCLMAMEYFLLKGQDFTGFHLIFDLTNFKLGHLTRFQVSAMRIMSYTMKAYPVSFTAINLINYPSFVEKAIALFKPFISSKLFSRVALLKDVQELRDAIGNEVKLPSDYGGEKTSQKEYNEIMKNKLLSIKDYLLECDKIRCDDSKRLNKETPCLIDNGLHGSFRKLCID